MYVSYTVTYFQHLFMIDNAVEIISKNVNNLGQLNKRLTACTTEKQRKDIPEMNV